MDTRAVLNNLKTNGVIKTYKIYKHNQYIKRNRTKYHKQLETLTGGYMVNSKPVSDVDTIAMFEKTLDTLRKADEFFEPKDCLDALRMMGAFLCDNRERLCKAGIDVSDISTRMQEIEEKKGYVSYIKRKYIKELIPQLYEKESVNPVVDRVIFMENGNSPSPTGYALGKRLEKDGKYEVIYWGLHARQIPNTEYYERTLRFAQYAATAKVIFLSTANDLLSQFDLRPETKLIQLWHGVGMFKKCGWSTVDNKNFGKSEAARLEYDQYRNYYAVTIAGDGQAWTFEDAMRLEPSKIRSIGIARTDVFYDEEYCKGGLDKLHDLHPETIGKKIILYAPTFRGATANAQAPDQLDVSAMAKALRDEYILLIKHHGLSHNVPPIPEDAQDFAIDMGAEKSLGIERLLALADICITDYSSIGFEYAITERPMIFFVYDMDTYLDDRGMYYDFNEISPGPLCKTTEEIVDFIEHIDERFDQNKIKEFKQKYVNMCDGHALERTIALMEE